MSLAPGSPARSKCPPNHGERQVPARELVVASDQRQIRHRDKTRDTHHGRAERLQSKTGKETLPCLPDLNDRKLEYASCPDRAGRAMYSSPTRH